MIKHLFFSLIITSATIHSMELVLHNHDMLSHITHQICNEQPKTARRCIKTFSTTDKTLYEYYAREKTRQSIVRHIALHNELSDSMIALSFGYTTIVQKIDNLFDTISKKNTFLTEDDLKDKWYLNSTALNAHMDEDDQQTLFLEAIKNFKFAQAKMLIAAGIDCNSTRCRSTIAVVNNLHCYTFNENEKKDIFEITHALLKNKVHPDNRINPTHFTLLHKAAMKNDKPFAHLLLQYNADPYLTCGVQNAFTLEQGKPKGWLMTMVNEIKKNKKS